MGKFKVGDKVRTLAKPVGYDNEGYLGIGKEYEVERVFESVGTVQLVGTKQAWSEDRFELVGANPLATDFKVGDKVRRKPEDWGGQIPGLGWQERGQVCVVTRAHRRGDGSQSLTLEGVTDCGWDGYRFDPVEEVHVPQIPGVPEGYRAVRIGSPTTGESFINSEGKVDVSGGWHIAKRYVVVEKVIVDKVEPPVTPPTPDPHFYNVGDTLRVVCNNGYAHFSLGDIGTVVNVDRGGSSSRSYDMVTFKGPSGRTSEMYAKRFEKVIESPDDLVIQDLVPARTGIDRGWWVRPDQFDTWKVSQANSWGMYDLHAGKRHGDTIEPGVDRLVVMCYRRDLPTMEEVTINEYVAWDNGGPKCLLWSDTDPTIVSNSLGAWDNAIATGNTRKVEVPIVKK